jgi:hypothetical protein
MIGTAGYNACIGFKFAAFLAQSGKANALALSKLYVVVVHRSNGKHIKKLSRAVARLRAVETAYAILVPRRVAAVSLLEAQSPLKNVVHGWMRT